MLLSRVIAHKRGWLIEKSVDPTSREKEEEEIRLLSGADRIEKDFEWRDFPSEVSLCSFHDVYDRVDHAYRLRGDRNERNKDEADW